MPPLVLDRVRKVFGRRGEDVVAVEGLSIEVAAGELLAIVGPSGCGKTTTLRLVSGLDRLDGGSIRLGGRDLAGVPPEARDVAMVFQHGALYPHLSVRRNLSFPLEMRRVPADERAARVEEVARLLAIDSLLERRPHELAGGERQRVAIGRALVRRPALLLLDEPFSALDPPLRTRLRGELKALHARLGATALHVTHDQEEALALGTRVAVLAAGRLRQVSPPTTLFDEPADRFVATFVGAPSMNLIDGRIEGGAATGAGGVFRSGALALPLPDECAAHVGRDLALGIRATDLEPVAPDDPAAGVVRLDGIVRRRDPVGDRVDLVVEIADGVTLVARVSPRGAPAVGGRLPLRAAAIHLFAPGPEGAALAHLRESGVAAPLAGAHLR